MAPTQRASLTLSQPPPPTEPPPPLPQQLPASAAMAHLISPNPQLLALLAPTSTLLNSSLQKPRPRVPRMGTAVPVLPTVTTSQNLGGSFTGKHKTGNSVDNVVSNQDSNKTSSERGAVNLLNNHSSTSKSTKSTSERKLPPIHLILSSTRNGSHGISYDFRRLFKRYSCANERLTPISERTNGSLSPAKRLDNRSRSSSSSNCSELTETTNLSMTWPLSRSQTDLSNKVYRSISCSSDNGAKQAMWYETEKIVSTDTNQMNPLPTTDLECDSSETVNPPVRRSPEAEEWMRMIDSEEILRQLRSMRIVTLTAKRWRIKRRADGTRYLAVRKSNETSCCTQRDNSKTNLSTVVQMNAVESPKAHPANDVAISPVSQFASRKPRLHYLRPTSPKPTGHNQEEEKEHEQSDENTQKPTHGIRRYSPMTTLRGRAVNLLNNHSSTSKSTKSTSERKLPPIHLILSSTRNGSHGISYDFRRLFKRYSCANERLTPISERTNGSLSPAKRLDNRSRSSSSSNCSELTETTNLSMTWPLSRSQTDLSNKVYRSISCSSDNGAKQAMWYETEKIVSTDTNQMNPLPTTDLECDSSETVNPPVRRSPEAEEWMRMIDSEEILRQLRSMRIVTLTAKRWRIKRRADGTRYLAVRKSNETR
ncbi:hypothetical protein AHF37_04970 [Paragonimus kellicotti]|nr:hypothetical protein AHF37_04970 [Paragonimus kellicotti]